jgi:hypothetical protein
MERLRNEVLECSIYLYETEPDARAGTRTGGSGFLYKLPFDEEDDWGDGILYAVTNWHVASRAPVVRINTKDDKFEVLSFRIDQWIRHPDDQTDLAVIQIDPVPLDYKIKALGPGHLLNKERVREYDIGIGDEVFAIGRFINQEGEQTNQPTVRYGAIAQMPRDAIKTDIGGQDAYLAEIRSMAGYSGSPVIALIPGERDPNIVKALAGKAPDTTAGRWAAQSVARSRTKFPSSFMLLGIDCGHLHSYEAVLEGDKRTATGEYVKSNTGMAIVIGAWKLDELLDSKDVKRMRAKIKRPIDNGTDAGVARSSVIKKASTER